MNAPAQDWPALRQALLARQKAAKVLAAVVVVLALGLTGGLYAISDGSGGDSRVVKAFLQGGVMIVGGLIYMVWAFVHTPEKHKLLRAMKERPGDVVWMYRESRNSVPYINVAFNDKKRYSIPLEGTGPLLDEVWAEIRAAAPQANTGWSERKNKLYLQNPEAMLHGE